MKLVFDKVRKHYMSLYTILVNMSLYTILVIV